MIFPVLFIFIVLGSSPSPAPNMSAPAPCILYLSDMDDDGAQKLVASAYQNNGLLAA